MSILVLFQYYYILKFKVGHLGMLEALMNVTFDLLIDYLYQNTNLFSTKRHKKYFKQSKLHIRLTLTDKWL